MAARTGSNRLRESHRSAIQTSMILKRLADHVVDKCEMSATQVRAAEILLKKTLPDVTSIELSNADGETFKTEHSIDAKSLSTQTLKELLEARASTSNQP